MTVCTVFFTVFPESDEKNAEIFMKRIAGDMRQFMREVGGVMRVPHVETVLDVGEKHRRKIDELSKTIPKETGLSRE
jgi:ribosome-binding factor A